MTGLSSLCLVISMALLAVTPSTAHAEQRPHALTRCADWDDADRTWSAVATSAHGRLKLRQLDPPVLLPDGRAFMTWEVPPHHQRTFYVAQKHPAADDANPGTEDRPWKTISRAAALLEAGDRVIVKQGVYRECVQPVRGGTGPREMVTYQAQQGEAVIIRGSERYAGPWRRAEGTEKVWELSLPDTWIGKDRPFGRKNWDERSVANQNAKSRARGRKFLKKAPHNLSCGLVFQDGRRLRQVETRGEVAKTAGSYWVGPEGRHVLVRFSGDRDPRDLLVELTTRQQAFAPARAGLGFIRVQGFTIEQVASPFPKPAIAALSTGQGHHWIISDNTVSEVNSVGLDCGRRPSGRPRIEPRSLPPLSGVGHIVRGNRLSSCGVAGSWSMGVIGCLIDGNTVAGCGWHDVLEIYKTGGIKLLYVKHSVIQNNLINGTIGAPGFWIDHSNVNMRLTRNLVIGTRAAKFGGIFFEASFKPNMIDHNIVWDCKPHAFYQHDCEQLLLAHNLFGVCSKSPIHMGSNRNRIVRIEDERRAACRDNRVAGNVFYGAGAAYSLPAGNHAESNLFLHPRGASFDLAGHQKRSGLDAGSAVRAADLKLDADRLVLTGYPADLPDLPRLSAIAIDLLGRPRDGKTTTVGPFIPRDIDGPIFLRHHIDSAADGR